MMLVLTIASETPTNETEESCDNGLKNNGR